MFRVFGIQLAVHATFFLLLAYAGYEGWMEAGAAGLGWRVLLTVCFFLCVVLHELGHSLTARRYGVQVPRILLLPIGGMAEFDRIPRRPSAEFLITIAGPAVNFAIAAMLLPLTWRYVLGLEEFAEFSVAELGSQLFLANLVMGIFNLVPVYPMDGGRILRAILANWLPYLRATWWAVTVARILAPVLAVSAVYFLDSWMLAVLFLFILIAGQSEYRLLLLRERQAAYWAAIAQQVGAASSDPDDPHRPPLIVHGPN